MHVQNVVAAEFDTQLTNRFQERQRFDVTDRAADLDHAHVRIACAQPDAMLDLIGDVRNDLNSRA